MTGHLTQKELESYLWGAATLLRGLVDASDYKQYIFPLLFFKRLSDVWDEDYQQAFAETKDAKYAAATANDRFAIPAGAHWKDVRTAPKDVGRALLNAFQAIESANPERLQGVFGNAPWTDKAQLPDATLKNLIEHFSKHTLSLANVPEDELGNGYEYLIKQFADDSGHTAQEFYTNRTLVHLMAQMLEPKAGESVYDPTCGTGGMLISCLAEVKRRGGDTRTMGLYGQELITITAAIARMNLVLHGVSDFHVAAGNTLAAPAFAEGDRDKLGKAAAKMAVLVKAPARIAAICADIAQHLQEKVAPNGFGAQVVTFDRESCVLYKKELDKHLPPEVSDIVMSVNSGETEYEAYKRDRDAEEKLLDRFRDPKDPLKILIVTSKLLTGFDAPILQTMYLDKPLRDHTLLQAICRVNRPYSEEKTHGLIVDYLGIFDDVAQALQFDEKGVRKAVSNIAELVGKLPAAMQKCLAYFAGCDRTLQGYEGLIAAQECLPNNSARDAFAADFSVLARIWEAVSPDPVLTQYEKDFRWLVQVYESLKPSTGTGRLLWHRLGAKTIELIHQNVHVDAVRDDLDTLVLDADLLQAVLGDPDSAKKGREVSIKLTARLRKHAGNPKYKALAERLEDLKNRHEQGLLVSIDFLKALLDLAKDVVRLERETPPADEIDRGKAALTLLFEEAKNGSTPVMVKRVVDDIDEIVRAVRFDGWQNTHAGEREVKIALRKTLFKYKLHQDNGLFERAYVYIKEYY